MKCYELMLPHNFPRRNFMQIRVARQANFVIDFPVLNPLPNCEDSFTHYLTMEEELIASE